MVRVGWEGVDRADGERRVKLGDGIAAPVVAGEGAIDPGDLPPFDGVGGRERRSSRGRCTPTGHDGPPTVHSHGSSLGEGAAKRVEGQRCPHRRESSPGDSR